MPRMDPKAHFSTSNLPAYLEWYRCYEDLSRSQLVDGMELFNHWDKWDETQRARWGFFFRPIRSRVGQPQKRRIWWREVEIRGLRQKLSNQAIPYGMGLFMLALLALVDIRSPNLIGFVTVAATVATLVFLAMRSATKNEILRYETEILELQTEIATLIQQIPPKMLPAETLESELCSEIQGFEREGLSTITSKLENDPSLFADLKVQFKAPSTRCPIESLLVEGWGLVQRAYVHGPFGREGTGLVTAYRALGKGVSAWRVGSQGQPLFRLLFLQFIFPLAKNLNAYSLFYDVVTKSQFGCRSEVFQYDHVTNLTLREVGLDEQDWLQGLELPDRFRDGLFRREYHALGVAVASGASFKCVLTDQEVVEGLKDWLESEDRFREVAKDHPEDEVSVESAAWKAVGHRDAAVAAESAENEASAIAELRSGCQVLQPKLVTNAVLTAQEVRRQLEHYVHTVAFTEHVAESAGFSTVAGTDENALPG